MSGESDDSVVGLPIENIVIAGASGAELATETESPVSSPPDTSVVANEPSAIPTLEPATTPRPRVWHCLPKATWRLEAFGAIYSLLWRDVNHDGVNELLVASATGVYVFEADVDAVLRRLEQVLGALPTTGV